MSIKELWSGVYIMNEQQTITLAERISDQIHGIVLHWSAYANGKEQNYWHNYQYVPKSHVTKYENNGVCFFCAGYLMESIGVKYLYISNNQIKGNAHNMQKGTGAVPYDNTVFVLRSVIGV